MAGGGEESVDLPPSQPLCVLCLTTVNDCNMLATERVGLLTIKIDDACEIRDYGRIEPGRYSRKDSLGRVEDAMNKAKVARIVLSVLFQLGVSIYIGFLLCSVDVPHADELGPVYLGLIWFGIISVSRAFLTASKDSKPTFYNASYAGIWAVILIGAIVIHTQFEVQLQRKTTKFRILDPTNETDMWIQKRLIMQREYEDCMRLCTQKWGAYDKKSINLQRLDCTSECNKR